jgi:Zn-dependent alcohol dehydrogenase
MKAVVFTKYGTPDVLELKEVDKPVPKDNEVLIKVYAASISEAPEAMRYFGEGKHKGKIVIALCHNKKP